MEAIEKQTQQYVKEAAATSGKEAPGTGIGPARPLLVIPVVVHILWNNASQNLSDAVVQGQIDILNADFRRLNADVGQVPGAFAPFVGDGRVSFCLATRDPNGNPTNGITRRNTSVAVWGPNDNMKAAATGGTNAWNTSQYLNIWCCNLGNNLFGYAYVYPIIPTPSVDGVVVNCNTFGKGSHLLYPTQFHLGRTATHEVGHWLGLSHIWGDAPCGNDYVADTPEQQSENLNKPTFPKLSMGCNQDPNGDMFMNYMDYVDDDVMVMFSAGQALRMQAIFGPGGYRESLKSSPGLNPILGISTQGPMPTAVFCGDQTDYRFRPTSVSTGCGGGSLQLQWAATNGWTVTNPNSTITYPRIIPNGTSGSTITLTGTYTNLNGVSFPMNTASVTVGYNAVPPTPVFTGGSNMLCATTPTTFTVGNVPGATGYLWSVSSDFTPTGQITTTVPSLTITPNAGLAPGAYSVGCQVLASGSCPPSALAFSGFSVNGGLPFMIVDENPSQRSQGLVCQQNRIQLALVPVSSGTSATATGTVWTGLSFAPNSTSDYRATLLTIPAGGVTFTVNARYTDGCGNTVFAIPYTATTASSSVTSLANGYSCIPNRYRAVPLVPYPNPATGSLQLPGYAGQVVVYNQQGKPVQTLLAPGTDYGATVDTSAWPDGLYVVTGRSLTGGLMRHNVQIQH